MCTDCDAKEYELIHLHKEVARLITENHFLNKRVDGLLADNNALRAATAGLEKAGTVSLFPGSGSTGEESKLSPVFHGQQHISRKTGAM